MKIPIRNFVQSLGDKIQYLLVNDSQEVTLKYLAEEKEVVQGFPYAFVIDRKGQVVWQRAPMNGMKDFLVKLFSEE